MFTNVTTEGQTCLGNGYDSSFIITKWIRYYFPNLMDSITEDQVNEDFCSRSYRQC